MQYREMGIFRNQKGEFMTQIKLCVFHMWHLFVAFLYCKDWLLPEDLKYTLIIIMRHRQNRQHLV